MNNISKAIEFATLAHKEQMRKSTPLPYIAHPFEVALILAQNNADDDTIVAGILHDTVEDTATTMEEIVFHFGTKIAEIVGHETENKALSWEERKQHTIDELPSCPIEVKMVTCADKLSNIRGIHNELGKFGNKVWDRFNRGYDKQKWYYTQLVRGLSSLEHYTMYQELKDLVATVFAD